MLPQARLRQAGEVACYDLEGYDFDGDVCGGLWKGAATKEATTANPASADTNNDGGCVAGGVRA